jgi:phosphoribosylformylglycinamidine synthase
LKPLQGKGRAQASATVVRPVLSSKKGVAVSQALFPRYGDLDCYWMAATAIETALRNLVAAGAKKEETVLLDNFCWCSSNEPERLYQLKQAVQACYDFAIGFETPFVSGKDIMFNDFKGFDEKGNAIKISVPPTLLISSFGIVQNSEKCVSLDAKFEGDSVFMIGETRNELGGSEYLAHFGEKSGNRRLVGTNVPRVELKESILAMNVVEELVKRELIASIQPTGLGGLGVALAKTCVGGRLGCRIDLQQVPRAAGAERSDVLLFSESTGRFLITADPKNEKEIERVLSGEKIVFAKIGFVQKETFEIFDLKKKKVVSIPVPDLEKAYKKTFEGF